MLIEFIGNVPMTSNGIQFTPNCKVVIDNELGERLLKTFSNKFSEVLEAEVIEKPKRTRRKPKAKDEVQE